MVAVAFEELSFAFEFVGSSVAGENNAYISLDTGKIYCTSEFNSLDEEVPDDLETSDRYVLVPHKTDLGLGKVLALRFAANELPQCYDRIAGFFREKGAYARFKDLLGSEGILDPWYRYEAAATERALRDWCVEHDVQLVAHTGNSAAQSGDAALSPKR